MATPAKKFDKKGQNINVFVRVRPLNSSEKNQRSWSVVDTPNSREVVAKENCAATSRTKKFTFDRVFGPNTQQNDVYKSVVSPLVKEVLQGYNCTVFAYGQTGTGKTFTMEGNPASGIPIEKDPDAGIIPRALNALFDGLRVSEATEWSVRVSFLELYNEEIFDLLSGTDDQSKLRLYEDGVRKGSVIIQGLEELQVHDKQEVYRILERGSEKRRTAETKMNANSSRSHTVFTVTVFINQQSLEGDDMLKIGKLNLVDLAGSENIGRSGAVDKRAREAGQINQSLLTLGRVITCLVDRAPHIPYRESKLTRLLQDSLGGRTKTSIIATVSPASINLEETLSTLDYAHRAKNIQNKPEVNQKISKKEKLLEYHAEIDKLKLELQAARDKDGVFLPKDVYDQQVKDKENSVREIRELTMNLDAVEKELEKFKEIISETTAKLEETTAQRDKTQRALECTKTVLHKTEFERAEQESLVKCHVETERKLRQQADSLLEVADEATKDVAQLHDKVDRKKKVETSNEQTLGTFRQDQSERHSKLEHMITEHVQVQTDHCGRTRSGIDATAERRTEERSQITAQYADTVSKLVQNLGDIERLTSDNLYTEQSWVEQLLKRVRNEADTASKDFHNYLMEQLLTITNKIMTSLQKQDQSVQELDAKMDKHFAGLSQKLDAYLDEQNELRQKKNQIEHDFFAGLANRNSALSTAIDLDTEATREYLKKSNAFTEQMMGLIQARAKEDEAFIAARNASLSNAKSLTTATSEASTSVQTEFATVDLDLSKTQKHFQDNNEEIVQKMKTEKAQALKEINAAGQEAAKATANLRSDAEAFTQKAKDQWTDHYKRTEIALREKSDKSNAHVTAIQDKTGSTRQIIQASQSDAEETIETWRRADEQATREAHDTATAQCAELTEFGVRLRDQIRASDQAVSILVQKQFKRDVPTGQTPGRVERSFPRTIVEGTPDDIRKQRFRAKWDVSGLAAKIDFEASDSDLIQEEDIVSEGSLNDTRDSVFSGSKMDSGSLSRQNSAGSMTNHQMMKKTSQSNLSEASTADTGIVGDIDNKENFNNRQFPRPTQRPSKLRQPESISERSSRSGSRTRQKVHSVK